MFLYNSNQAVVSYILKSFLLCSVVAMSMALILNYFEVFKGDSPSENITFYDVIGASLVSPFFEVGIIYILVSILGWVTESKNIKAIIVAAILSSIHSLVFPFWGLVSFFSFFVFSISYLVWSVRKIWLGLFVSMSIHCLLNFFSLLFVYFGQFYY